MIYLCDTCVLIDYLRGKNEVQQKLEQDKGFGLGMSSITYMELMVGALNKREVGIIKKTFSELTFRIGCKWRLSESIIIDNI